VSYSSGSNSCCCCGSLTFTFDGVLQNTVKGFFHSDLPSFVCFREVLTVSDILWARVPCVTTEEDKIAFVAMLNQEVKPTLNGCKGCAGCSFQDMTDWLEYLKQDSNLPKDKIQEIDQRIMEVKRASDTLSQYAVNTVSNRLTPDEIKSLLP